MTNTDPITPEAIFKYLKQNPNFFVDHPEKILDIKIPHECGKSVSLVEHQLKLLREKNDKMNYRFEQLVDVARDNDLLFDRTRRLVLSLLDATHFEEIITIVEDTLRNDFQVPFVSLILFSKTPLSVNRSEVREVAEEALGNLISSKEPICGTFREKELTFLFGEESAERIGSSAIVSISHQKINGILAIASPLPSRYKNSTDTVFLAYIADIISRVLPGSVRSLPDI